MSRTPQPGCPTMLITGLPAVLSPAQVNIPTPPRRSIFCQNSRGISAFVKETLPKGRMGKRARSRNWDPLNIKFKRPPFPSHSICSLTLPLTPRASCSCSLPQNLSNRQKTLLLPYKSRKLEWTEEKN